MHALRKTHLVERKADRKSRACCQNWHIFLICTEVSGGHAEVATEVKEKNRTKDLTLQGGVSKAGWTQVSWGRWHSPGKSQKLEGVWCVRELPVAEMGGRYISVGDQG